ncbi:MAG: hypothetical protein IBJ19_16105 [Gemmatimonadaceae bacterium]|nr:hypothetical protein [Gemmatimonadaceae bacterium]
MQRLSTPSNPWQDLRPRDVVSFCFEGATVKAEVLRLDEKAHAESPLGAPYRVYVVSAEPGSGYVEGREYTVRAACLVPDGDVSDRPLRDPQPGPLVSGARTVVSGGGVGASSALASPMFLVGYLREGGQFPVQGVLLVQAVGLNEANALATQTLQAELEADLAAGREQEGAMVMLVNAAEVDASAAGGVVGQVSW